MKILYKITLLVFIFSACEEQMIPVPPPPEIAEGRVMLIEEMTGVGCVPCFGAAEILESFLETNKGSIVAYGVHGDILSDPVDQSTYDFRLPDAIDIIQILQVTGKPAAAFNRTILNENTGRRVQANPPTWQAFVDTELQKQQVVEIRLLSTFNEETRQAEIDVSVIPLEPISGELALHVKISESHLIDSQSSPNGIVLDFEHNHVLKTSASASQGDLLVTDAVAGESYAKKYFYSLPDELNEEWTAENMEIIAFVTAKDRNGEVQQAAQVHMME